MEAIVAEQLSTKEEVTPGGSKFREMFSYRKIGGLYLLILVCVYFTLRVPDTFATSATAQQILNSSAITAMVALALVFPLSSGVFDISVANTMTLSGVVATYLITRNDLPVALAVVLALCASLLVGVVNGILVVVLKIDSLIGTLATGALIQSCVSMVTNDTAISDVRLLGSFSKIASGKMAGLTLPVLYAAVFAAIIWHVQERTAAGRKMYAIGFNRDASRLAGVRVERYQFATFMVSSAIAGFAGIVLASRLGSGSPAAGSPYLLPAFAGVFLGATQFKGGRFNAGGTLLAVVLLSTGTIGLALQGTEVWAQSMFTGVVLIAALAITTFERRGERRRKSDS